jgi:hypothetical protein
MEVEPRGATVLLAKELTATNTIQLYQMTQFGEAEGAKGVEILRGLEAAMQIPAGTYVESVQEQEAREQAAAEAAEAGEEQDPMVMIEERKMEVMEAEVELRMARDKVAEMVAIHKSELDAARLQLEDAIATSNIDGNTQARLDQYHAKMAELEHKRETQMSSLQQDNQNKRDMTAAQLSAQNVQKRQDANLKEREIANREQELSYKITTGNQGI